MTSILVVDDEVGVRELLRDAYELEGYEVFVAPNGVEALALVRHHEIDLCVLDISMPDMDGLTLLETLRAKGSAVPVILLSARNAASDIERGLRYGADDYVRKPFGLSELLLRTAAILRRTSTVAGDDRILTCGDLRMDIARHEVHVNEELVDLSATEFRLLEQFLANQDRVLTRTQLLRDVWEIDFDTESSVVDTYVSYLRRKIHREGFAPLKTIRGVGFKMSPSPAT